VNIRVHGRPGISCLTELLLASELGLLGYALSYIQNKFYWSSVLLKRLVPALISVVQNQPVLKMVFVEKRKPSSKTCKQWFDNVPDIFHAIFNERILC
jgi:hypothetical protein